MNEKFTLIFDGHCNLCNGSVAWIMKNKRHEKFKFISGQSEEGRKFLIDLGFGSGIENPSISGEEFDSILLLDTKGNVFKESDAVLKIASELGGFYHLTVVCRLVPKRLRDAIYRWVARNRYRFFGKTKTCEVKN